MATTFVSIIVIQIKFLDCVISRPPSTTLYYALLGELPITPLTAVPKTLSENL